MMSPLGPSGLHHLPPLATKVQNDVDTHWKTWIPTGKGENTMADRVAVITGAGSGIGRASALALCKDGWSVALLGRRKEALEETAGLAAGGKTLPIPTDVADPDQVIAAFTAVKERFGRVDMLFNNAGGNVPATNFGDFTWEMWRRVVAVNLDAMFMCANQAFRMMRDQTPRGGRIINNGSISAHVPRPGSVAYTSTKHGVTGLTKSIALDGRQYDICSGQIDIGNAATPMTARSTNGQMQPYGQMAVEARMDVNHVGQQVAFMANLPLESNVQFVTIMATKMPFVGRG
jgi:NAD(P)-dependent dehydrogenase (short-subunit alcohol dehydrogenase family)